MKPTLSFLGFDAIPTYPLIISLTLMVSLFWTVRRAMVWGIRRVDILDASMALMTGSFIGGRLFHVVFEHPRGYWEYPMAALLFWRGGFVFYGGLFLALSGLWLLCRQRGLSYYRTMECLLPVICVNVAFGRIACFFAGCCYGKPTSLPWGVTFPPGSLTPAGIPLHPTQLYESLFWFALCAWALLTDKASFRGRPSGQRLPQAMIAYGMFRFLVEFFRNDDRGPLLFSLSQAQFFSILLSVVAGALFFRFRKAP